MAFSHSSHVITGSNHEHADGMSEQYIVFLLFRTLACITCTMPTPASLELCACYPNSPQLLLGLSTSSQNNIITLLYRLFTVA